MATASLDGFPGSESTGVRPGVELTQVGDLTVTEPGAVISGLEIHGRLTIQAPDVTVVDCKIVNNEYHAIYIPNPYEATIEHCDIIGGTNGISGTGTFRYNDISQSDNGINVYGGSTIEDNYIHDLSGGPDSHYDGIEINGGGGTVIRHNTVINDHDQTSAIMIDNYFGGVDGIIVDNNYLAGGGYTIYSDGRFTDEPITGVEITNNVLGEGHWGYFAFMENDPVVSNNTELGQDFPTSMTGSDAGDTTSPDPEPAPPPDDSAGTTDPGTGDGSSSDDSGSGTSDGGTSDASGGTSDGSGDGGTSDGSGDGTSDGSGGGTSDGGTSDGGSGGSWDGNDGAIMGTDTGDSIRGTSADDILVGLDGNDSLRGGRGDDTLEGGDGRDSLIGGSGDDTLVGGHGVDQMTGGAGNDTFAFEDARDTGWYSYTRDVITDFTQGKDVIDLSQIDADGNAKSGNGTFSFVAENDALFTHKAGEIAWHTVADQDLTVIQADTDGDGWHDFEINLTGIVHLTAQDFIF